MTATLSPRSTTGFSPARPWPVAAPHGRQVPLVVVPAPAPRPSAATYRRRRLLVAGLVALLLVPALLSVRAGVAWLGGEATAGVTSPAPAVLVAEPGDSYWTLAGRLHRGGDLRSTVDALVRANGGRELRAGDRLVLAP